MNTMRIILKSAAIEFSFMSTTAFTLNFNDIILDPHVPLLQLDDSKHSEMLQRMIPTRGDVVSWSTRVVISRIMDEFRPHALKKSLPHMKGYITYRDVVDTTVDMTVGIFSPEVRGADEKASALVRAVVACMRRLGSRKIGQAIVWADKQQHALIKRGRFTEGRAGKHFAGLAGQMIYDLFVTEPMKKLTVPGSSRSYSKLTDKSYSA